MLKEYMMKRKVDHFYEGRLLSVSPVNFNFKKVPEKNPPPPTFCNLKAKRFDLAFFHFHFNSVASS